MFSNLNEAQLSAVYQLRVKAWDRYGMITHSKYPDGFSDALDQSALHWTITVNTRIVASARLNHLSSIDELPYPKMIRRVLNFDGAIFFYSRLVVDPDHQGNNFSGRLDEQRMEYVKSIKDVRKVIATAGERRCQKLIRLGFSVIGTVLDGDDYKPMDGQQTFILAYDNL